MSFADIPLLSTLVWLPILSGIGLMLMDGTSNDNQVKRLALLVTVICFILSVYGLTEFNPMSFQMQFTEYYAWIPLFDINYSLGIDGLAYPLILLTTLSGVLVVLAGWATITKNLNMYMAAILVMQGLMCGVFSALDAILFYVFWEAMLVPMFIIIGIWGGVNRVYATIKFFLYTFLGSIFLLVAMLYLHTKDASFLISDWYSVTLSITEQKWLFFAFLLAFAVKIPMWPVHTWLPDAHVQAPTGGSVILAAIMLKMGGYGFIRFSMPITPDASNELSWLMISLSLIAVVYIGFVAIVQTDMKKLIAYSSIAHMGFVTLGCFTIYEILRNTGSLESASMGVQGAMVQMLSHGFISGALFLCVGVLYDRMRSREINDYGGVASKMPVFAALLMIFAMANSGLPGTSGFVGEFLVIVSAFQANIIYALLAATVLILGPAYTLWMYKRVIFGKITNHSVEKLTDVNIREGFILGTLALLVIVFGIWPAPMLKMMNASIEHLLYLSTSTKIL